METANEYHVEDGALRVDGELDFLYRPSGVMAFSGTLRAGVVPMRQGSWRNWLTRLFDADRFMLRHGVMKGTLWLGLQDCPFVTALPADNRTVTVRSEFLLFAERSRRLAGKRLHLVPGSVRNIFALTELDTAAAGAPAFVCTASPLHEAQLEEGETLHLSPNALVAWGGCPKPAAFCAKLRLRDLFLPRLPDTLSLDFKGPGWVLFQGNIRPDKKSAKRH
jgi:uncharacterized protein (AIM24 family)